jgi:hypothetical protein
MSFWETALWRTAVGGDPCAANRGRPYLMPIPYAVFTRYRRFGVISRFRSSVPASNDDLIMEDREATLSDLAPPPRRGHTVEHRDTNKC